MSGMNAKKLESKELIQKMDLKIFKLRAKRHYHDSYQ